MKQELFRMEQITKCTNGTCILNRLSLNLFQGEIVGLLGHSGSGKTAITQLLAGMENFQGGRLFVSDRLYPQFTQAQALKNRFFLIHKHSALIPSLSLAENIFILKPSTARDPFVHRKAILAETSRLLARVGLDDYPAQTPAGKLNAYEQTLVLLCRALAANAQLIILDSALENLSSKECFLFFQIVTLLHQEGISFLITDRTPKYLVEIADRIFVIQNGSNVKTFYRDSFDLERMTLLLSQRRNAPHRLRTNVSLPEPALEVQQLSFDDYSDISFSVNRGEILSILDRDGRFIRALADVLTGRAQPKGGEIFLRGKPVAPRSVDHAVRLGIGIIEHDALKHGILPNLSFDANCNLMILDKLTRHHVIVRKIENYLRKSYAKSLSQPAASSSAPVSHLDTHTQYQLLLTRWKIYAPPVLICLNPCSKSDIVNRNLIFEMLDTYSKMHIAVLILSSDPDDMLSISDRIYLYENHALVSGLL